MVEDKISENREESLIITVLGPTATGKTVRAVDIANELNGEIISGDSRQVYKGMDLGTGKDLEEYGNIPYYLIDICNAGEKYNLHRYVRDFHSSLHDIKERHKTPILCGGTGMYIETVLSGMRLPDVPENPELRASLEKYNLTELTEILKRFKKLHNTTDVDTVKRAVRAIEIEKYYEDHKEEALHADRSACKPLRSVIIGIDIPREERRNRISERLKKRLDQGMVEEVANLIKNGVNPDDLIYYGLEYKFLTLYVIGKMTFEQMKSELEIAIHQFAKRQMTWFRGMERRGFKINWLPFDMEKSEFVTSVKTLINK